MNPGLGCNTDSLFEVIVEYLRYVRFEPTGINSTIPNHPTPQMRYKCQKAQVRPILPSYALHDDDVWRDACWRDGPQVGRHS